MEIETFKQVGDWHTQTIAHGLSEPLLVRTTIQAAESRGLNRFCITDHYPLPPEFEDPTVEQDCSMPRDLYFGEYLKQVYAAQKEFQGKVEVGYGAEFDWLPDYVDWTKQETHERKYDFCIGSVHFLKDPAGKYRIIDYNEVAFGEIVNSFGGIEKAVRAYYREVSAMAASRIFDGVGHIDLVKKYSPPSNPLFDENKPWYREVVVHALDQVKSVDMSLEINTAGWHKKCQVQYPSVWVLEEAYNRGISLTIGSDAHKPEEIGRDLDRAVDLARNVGYKSIRIYRNRRSEELLI